jgi:hypothetical protein
MVSHPLAPGLSPTFTHGELTYGSVETEARPDPTRATA